MAIDKMHHANQNFLNIGQREYRHRARTVAGRFVDGLVVIKWNNFRSQVEIVDKYRFAGRRHLTGNRSRHDGNAEIRLAQFEVVILYAVGDKPILLAGFTHDEYRARLSAGHLPRLQKNTVKQLANPLLARLRDKL